MGGGKITMSRLLEHFGKRREAILALIRELVEMESKSRAEAELDRLARRVAGMLASAGGEVEVMGVPGYGAHLRARFGFGHRPEARSVLVIGHLDTVWPIGTLARKPFTVTDDGRATGPGIFDMKAGIAILIEALMAIHDIGLDAQSPVTVLLTCDEEIGSQTSRQLVEAEARQSLAALVLEPPLPGGILKTGRKGVGTFTIRAQGRAAHAGLDPRSGVSAIVELAHQTLRLAALNDDDRGVTVNIGMIEGGTALNVVPAEAEARVDLRFETPEDAERLVAAIGGLTPHLPGAAIKVTGGVNRPAMTRSEKNLALFETARSLAVGLGMDLREGVVGGGSDGNFTAALGVPTLDGLGVDGDGAHAEHEHILIDDIPRRAALLTGLLCTAGVGRE